MPSPNPPTTLTKDVSAPPIWARPDPALADAGIDGESVVATVRVLAMSLLIIAPRWNLLHHAEELIYITGFTVTLVAGLVAVFIRWSLKRGRWRPWVGVATSAFDVSMVTLALISFLVVASPLVALNSTVTFEMYFLALVATSLRYDARICIAIGLLTISEYGTLWAFAASRYDLADLAYVLRAGPYLPVDLWTRTLLLSVATLLSVMIVRRAQRLLYLASHDRLTGLFNRAHFDRALGATLQSAARDQQPLSLAMIDVDHFKQINRVSPGASSAAGSTRERSSGAPARPGDDRPMDWRPSASSTASRITTRWATARSALASTTMSTSMRTAWRRRSSSSSP